VLPLAPGRYKVQFTASAELHDKLERLRDLLRRRIPDGDLAAIIEEAVSEKLERLEARRFGQTKTPRTRLSQSDTSPGSRHIPAAVKRAVSERDGRRCRYQNQQGRRCPARSGLEFHHQYPFAFGGERGPDNIVFLCRPHNQLLADHDYGATSVARQRSPDHRSSDPPSRRRSPSTPTSPP
jgi:5-methylcytosine-specific restriction endonuclease McrA